MINIFKKELKTPYYKGSKKDFNKYFSGYGRNLVQRITKSHKTKIGKCEHCGVANTELDAAHVHGKERKEIIYNILSNFSRGEIVEVNLDEFENRFIAAHEPIKETIKILCKKCHRDYDNDETKTATLKSPKEIIKPISPLEQNKNQVKQSKMKQRPNKKKIRNYIKNVSGEIIDKNNFNISTINNTGGYSVEPKKNCPNSDWHLCLINTKKQTIHYFLIPRESAVYGNLYFREDKNRYRLLFETTDKNFTESLRHEHFGKFFKKEIKYEDSLIFD
tara:strand:+ start:260 stop:1087 length:828 start_codon:yes stop_codon:yes gene_type:complete